MIRRPTIAVMVFMTVVVTVFASACGKRADGDGGGNSAALTGGSRADDASDVERAFAPFGPANELCKGWLPAVDAGHLNNSTIDEVSGIAVSRRHTELLWVHNDSGEKKARIFGISATGKHRATFKLKGVTPRDWEDIAIAPCAASGPFASTPCVYIADTGDNGNERKNAWIHRVAEPTDVPALVTGQDAPTERFRKPDTESFIVRFPKAPNATGKRRTELEHPDIEAMAVLPDTRVILLSKRSDGRSDVFRVRLDAANAQGETTADWLGELDMRDADKHKGNGLAVTGADLSQSGQWLLVRCYKRIYLFDAGAALRAPLDEARTALSKVTRQALQGGEDLQGEAIAWAPDGGFWHTSEGNHQPLWRVRCAPQK